MQITTELLRRLGAVSQVTVASAGHDLLDCHLQHFGTVVLTEAKKRHAKNDKAEHKRIESILWIADVSQTEWNG